MGRNILVVEDDKNISDLIHMYLVKEGFDVRIAGDGGKALEEFQKKEPDLILLDIMMPDMDGYEVIRHLKADPALQDIPVIFLTALHNPEDIVKGFKLGASDYVSKPFNHEELITRVSHHIYLAAAQRTIMRQRDELQATVDARDKMYSVIAHDLRSPIGTLKMVFNMLSINLTQEQIGEDNMEMITMGNNITESTFMLLDNLLKWTKSQIGRMNTVFQEVDISEVVVFASKMSDLVAQVKNIAVEYDIPGPITVPCDVDMVKTIMRNLMSNAIKYSNEGGRIVIRVRETPTHAVISVRDFGTGISEEDLPKLLNPEIHYTTYGTKNEEASGTMAITIAQTMNFIDVKASDFFYEPVKWAVNNKITNGTSSTTFSPYKNCNRAEIVTFLWRAAGSPEPTVTRNPFTDVNSVRDASYYKAILWASQKGITAGSTATTFSPYQECTRSQIVTFLYRYAGKPSGYYSNPFKDVSSVNEASYYNAILWAVGKGITQGTSTTTFSPYASCTRGEAVTFLYRYVNGVK